MKSSIRNRFILAFGSNATAEVRSNAAILTDAVQRFHLTALTISSMSRFWRTPAFPVGAGPEFANACALAEGAVSADEALDIAHTIEAEMGRVRGQRWGQRVIDIDILAMEGAVVPDLATWRHWAEMPPADQQRLTPAGLILPHPRLQDRGFVLAPMADVAPDWVHPVLGRSVTAMRDALDPAAFAGVAPL